VSVGGYSGALDSSIPASVGARADDGLVTMTGIVAFHYQRPEAEFICANVPGSVDARPDVTVILAGTVTSFPEQDDALAATRSAPGITEVDGRIIVVY